jgi:hypothetical protein
LKIGLPGGGNDRPFVLGANEVAFYGKVAPAMPAGLVPRCFDSAWHAETRQWHLLLEDLTDTHEIATPWPLPPSESLCRRMVRTLARVHAAWWDDARLGVEIGTRVDAEAARQAMQRHAGAFEGFATIWAIACRARGASSTSASSPPRPARYFDWDAWRIGLASGDLAYMMERRRRFEQPLLDHYHAALLGADAAPPADAADDGRPPSVGVVEPSRAHHGSHRRSRLPRTAWLITAWPDQDVKIFFSASIRPTRSDDITGRSFSTGRLTEGHVA